MHAVTISAFADAKCLRFRCCRYNRSFMAFIRLSATNTATSQVNGIRFWRVHAPMACLTTGMHACMRTAGKTRTRFSMLTGPPPTWMVGNLLPIMKLGFPQAMQKWAAEYGGVFKIFQGESTTGMLCTHDVFSSFSTETSSLDRSGLLILSFSVRWRRAGRGGRPCCRPQSRHEEPLAAAHAVFVLR